MMPIRYLLFFLLIAFFILSCKSNLGVEGTKQEERPRAFILLGHLENRDIRYIPYTAENFRDMLKFEFLKAGFALEKMDMEEYQNFIQKDESNLSDKVGDLPLKFKPAAGENFYPYRKPANKNLSSKQIVILGETTKFTYFIQGAIALHHEGKLLEEKENNLFFLNIYNNTGRQIGMISFTIEERSLHEAELLKKLCNTVVKTFQEKIKDTTVVKQ